MLWGLGFVLFFGLAMAIASNQAANDNVGTNSATNAAAYATPEPWDQDMAQKYAGPSLPLRDPDSAKYDNVTYRTRHGEPYICGYVNAKNGFGAYVGDTAFIVGGGQAWMEGHGSASKFKSVWVKACEETDASDAAKAAFSGPQHPTPTALTPQEAAAKVLPLLHLASTDHAVFSRTTYRTQSGLPVTCGYVGINGGQPVQYVSAMGHVTRADTTDAQARELFPNTWRELCVLTDADQDGAEPKLERGK
jgi:hypothetical protein